MAVVAVSRSGLSHLEVGRLAHEVAGRVLGGVSREVVDALLDGLVATRGAEAEDRERVWDAFVVLRGLVARRGVK